MKEKLRNLFSSLSRSVKSGKTAFDKMGTNQEGDNKQSQIFKQVRFENPVKSVGMKLFLMFFISILLFVLVVGMVSYQLSKGVIKEKVSVGSQQTITQAGKKLDFVFQTLEDTTLQIMLDKEIQDLLAAVPNIKSGSYESLESSRKITDKLNVFLFANKNIKSLQLYETGGKLINMVGNSTSLSGANVSGEAWFKQTMENNGKASWLDTKEKGYSGGTASSFAIGRVLKNTTTSNNSGILLIEFGTEVLVNEIGAINLGPESEVGITNATNKYIATANNANLEKAAKIQLTKEELALAPGTSGSFENADRRMVAYYKTKISGWNLVAHMPVSSLVKDADKIFNFTLIIALVASLIATLIGLFVARSIGRPLVLLRNLMQQGAKGNLTVRANYQSQDEIGQLGKSFDVMMQQITGLVQQTRLSAQLVLETAGELTNSSKTTAIAAREIATATDEISNGAAGLATESERGNELTQHIGARMKKVIEANLEMGTSAADVQSSSEQGTRYMSELISKTNLTEEMIRSMVEKVDNLKESTRSIRKILDMLNNMTKQTNILSLNATIEAARAGAAGKGFMVVADEIRKLADQSRQSIDIVGQITETIQKEIDETVKVLSNATPIFQEQIQSVKEADTIFKQVTTHMSGFIEQLSTVSDSISTLDQSQIVLSDAMTNVSAVAEQSLATSEEVASLSSEQLSISDGLVKLSDQLEHLSNSLKDTLSKFEVE
ncbi:methyl-accepting chemotaxis protein [Paenibacillus sp. GP183]|uniref:methyl-accepting chemotaxis protein n=1 Tax=Paenibacillus sp. GP183 TaxID=1882751 RepID=UPI0008966145|nr:methyl-accepting chemotaxis protein [Paenibacillus sp. GP183]SEC74018.1 methyl-accepting chemotaxis protein [Paenibacillus sp. GP183]